MHGIQPEFVPVDDAQLGLEPSPNGGGHLLGHLLRFGQLLRVMGVDVSTGQVLDLVDALRLVPITQRSDFYHTCRALLVNRREDFLVFEQAFRLFWRADGEPSQPGDLESGAEVQRARLPATPSFKPETDSGGEGGQTGKPGQDDEGRDTGGREQQMIYSPD
jgi:uncharacterized protein with von Willebrand factor type A (vWA) domain